MDKRLLLLPVLLLASSLYAMDTLVRSEGESSCHRYLEMSRTEDAQKNGKTALHFASLEGDLGVVTYLTKEQGAQVDVKDNLGYTPLHCASRNGHLEVVTYLIEEQHAQVGVQDKQKRTALHWASSKGHPRVVTYLIEDQKAQVDVQDYLGYTPLLCASKNGHLEVVTYLTKERGAQMGVKANGLTPLHWASYNGHLEVVRCLIERGAQVDTLDGFGRIPMDLATDPEIKKLLAPKSLLASYAAYPGIALGIVFILWLAKKHVMDSSTENDNEKTGDASELGKAENETY